MSGDEVESNFATFWKCALQVNPWNYNEKYQGGEHGLSESDYNQAILEKLQKNDIRVIGIADHGSVEGVDSLRDPLAKSGIVVLPGFEISSTEKVHMVCLYAEGTDVSVLNQNLGNLELTKGAATAPSNLSCLEIAKRVEEQGGFWYAAHATGSNGLLRLNQDGGGLHHIWTDTEQVLAAQIPGDISAVAHQEVKKILENKNPQYKRDRPIALLNAKDVRVPDDLDHDRVFSWVKMTEPTLEALRLACKDPESRVRLSHEINPAYYSRIEKIVIRRGYLDDLDVDLSPNLNAIVGGRGTGKSTLIESLRFALDLPPSNKDADRTHKGIIAENFAKEKAGIELTVTSFQQNSERYVVSRYYGEPAKVLDEEGNVLQLTPKDILPRAEVYGQNELLAIVQDPQAKAELLGRFLPDDAEVRSELKRVEALLRENREDLDATESKILNMEGQLEALPALLDKEKSFKKLGLDDQLNQVRTRESERTFVNEAEAVLEDYSDAVDGFSESVDAIEIPQVPNDDGLPNIAKLTEIHAILLEAKNKLEGALGQARTALEESDPKFKSAKADLDHALSAAEQQFNAEIDKLPSMKGKSVPQLAQDYKVVTRSIAELQPLGGQKTANETKLVGLNQARQTLLEQLDQKRGQRWTDLTKAVKKLNKRLEGQLRVEFEPARIREPLKQFLLGCDLDGIGEKRLAWIDACDTLTISEFVSCVRSGSEALLDRYKDDGMAKITAEAIAGLSATKLRELEELELPERLELLLNVNREGEQFREVGRLSTGQQCTAILHLLLLDNPDPLIIDQPEDNLDNAFIADHIVNELRSSKTKRQYVFATHNANIPVFGDAEWIGILQEQDGRSGIRASGSIDAVEVKELAANILEGGREAFTRRREKYGL